MFENGNNEVVVTDIKMPFWSRVSFMIKWAFAAIPAMFVLAVIGVIISLVLSLIFGLSLAGLRSLHN